MSLAQAHGAIPPLHSEVGRRLPIGEGSSLIRLALPIMAIALVNMGMSLTDAAMVAWLFGTDALAAVAVGSDLYSIVFYLGAAPSPASSRHCRQAGQPQLTSIQESRPQLTSIHGVRSKRRGPDRSGF